jgi:hypothetical protein
MVNHFHTSIIIRLLQLLPFVLIILTNFVNSLGALLLPKEVILSPGMKSLKKYIQSARLSLRLPDSLMSPDSVRNGWRNNTANSSHDLDHTFINNYHEVGTRVVTDIDDTVKSSGGVKLFGIPLGGIDVSST